MRKVATNRQLPSIPANALIEVFQPERNADGEMAKQYIAVGLVGGLTNPDAGASVTATADGTGTGVIAATADVVEITSDDATKQVALPAAVDGKVLRIHCPAVGCELISSVATDKINNVVVGATNEAALVAGTLYTLRYVASTSNWVMTGLNALGAVQTPVIPDAL